MKIVINKILREDVFCKDFNNLSENNIIDFSNKKIGILYGPNGTGKTSFAMALSQSKNSEYTIKVDEKIFTEKDPKIAHVINDQNGRNIIEGSTEDFILGDNIKREYALKAKLEFGFDNLFNVKLIPDLKNIFGMSTKSSPFELLISNQDLRSFVSDLANNKSKGKGIDRKKFLDFVRALELVQDEACDDDKFNYLVNDYKSKESIIKKLRAIQLDLIKEEKHLLKVDESGEAVRILEKYDYIDDCIVCDSAIEREKLLGQKKELNKAAIGSLSDQAKGIIENIIGKITGNDPFEIKSTLESALRSGTSQATREITDEIKRYERIFDGKINNLFISSVADRDLIEVHDEYEKLIIEKPEFESEDIIFIEKFLSECLERKITLTRDANSNLKLLLGAKEFLNHERSKLLLSNGEQNFLSLAFELLKAKKVNEDIVVLDDPISSFDSIYKNKIAYAILKILSSKKTIVLTHNTDLIKLLEHQQKNCFNLYFLNNTVGELNGLIFVNPHEVKILLYIHEFLDLLRGEIKSEIIDERAFLISVIPFMRGYCQIVNNVALKNDLTKLMHGYQAEVFNVSEIYNKLFSGDVISSVHSISAQDIVSMDIDKVSILKSDKYPLLNKTLSHTLTYLYLRLNVENKLVDKFSINIRKHDMLSSIITAAFKQDSMEDMQNRVFFLSRKTLLNEFNHFEMDMNIFQPAIDITNQTLRKEKEEILERLGTL